MAEIFARGLGCFPTSTPLLPDRRPASKDLGFFVLVGNAMKSSSLLYFASLINFASSIVNFGDAIVNNNMVNHVCALFSMAAFGFFAGMAFGYQRKGD